MIKKIITFLDSFIPKIIETSVTGVSPGRVYVVIGEKRISVEVSSECKKRIGNIVTLLYKPGASSARLFKKSI